MSKQPKILTTILECVAVLIVGGIIISLLNRTIDTEPKVKNVIFMIGDGMGVSHITATMIHNSYEPLNMERATSAGLQKTYSANSRVTDSAAAGSALSTGYKTNNGMIGMTPDGVAHPSIREKAERAGMATGIIATYPVTNATPASFVGHVPHRSMEDSIATYYLSNTVDVIIGGGSRRFDQREDGRNFLDSLRAREYIVTNDLADIKDVTEGRVAVFPTDDSMPTVLHGRSTEFLPTATAKALEILTNNADGDGFFLMVEGSQIDGWAHKNELEGVITETQDFDNAVGVAFDYADKHPGTLVVVTADHETGGLTIVNGNRKFDLNDHMVDYAWTTGGHNGGMVPFFAYGTGAEHFKGVLENTDIPRIMCRLLGLDEN